MGSRRRCTRMRRAMAACVLLLIGCAFASSVCRVVATSSSLPPAGGSPASSCVLPAKAHVLLQFDLRAQKSRIQMTPVPATLQLLEELTGPLAIVSVAGMYRTGKSFLMNQLMPTDVTSKNVFSVGHTVQSHTEEVSVYIVPPCALGAPAGGSPQQAQPTLLFLDTPGLFAPNRAALFDSQLMAILNLISSVLVLNTRDVVNRESIKQLAHAIDAASAMAFLGKVKATPTPDGAHDGGPKDKLDRPHLIWTMQNFALRMEDEDGAEISSKVYLQKILALADESSNHTTSYTERFSSFFQSSDTAGLPFPGRAFKDAGRLDALREDELSEEYRTARDALRQRILRLATPKRFGATMLTGSTLSELMKAWVVEMANSGALAQKAAASSPDALLQLIADKETERLVHQYESRLSAGVELPCSSEALRAVHVEVAATLLSPYRAFSRGSRDPVDSPISGVPDFVASVQARFDAAWSRRQSENDAVLRAKFQALQADARQRINERMDALVLPAKESQVRALEVQLQSEWSTSIQSWQGLSPSVTSEFTHAVEGSIASAAATKRGKSVDRQREEILREARAALNPTPSSSSAAAAVGGSSLLLKKESDIQSIAQKARAKWTAVLEDMHFSASPAADDSSAAAAVAAADDASFRSELDRDVQQALARRQQALEETIDRWSQRASTTMSALLVATSAGTGAAATDATSASPSTSRAVDERAIELAASDLQAAWVKEAQEFGIPAVEEPAATASTAPASSASSLARTRFLTHLASVKQSTLARNRLLSQLECTAAAEKLLGAFELDAQRWWSWAGPSGAGGPLGGPPGDFEVYRRGDTIRAWLGQIRASDFCVGPSLRSSEVDALFRRSESTVLAQVARRSAIGWSTLCAIYLLGVLGLLAVYHLVRAPQWSVDYLPAVDRAACRLALPAAGLALVIRTLLPDADPHAAVTPMVVAWLVLVALVGARGERNAWKRYTRLQDKSQV